MADELKPCPFCGGKAKKHHEVGMFSYHEIKCIDCDVRVIRAVESYVIDVWGRRADTQRRIDEAVAAEREKIISASHFYANKHGFGDDYTAFIKLCLGPSGEITDEDIQWASDEARTNPPATNDKFRWQVARCLQHLVPHTTAHEMLEIVKELNSYMPADDKGGG